MAKALTTREKIAHLHRRLGFGVTLAELDAGERAGVDATVSKLVNFESQPAVVIGHPFELAFKKGEEAEPGAYRYRHWWVLAMTASSRPLQEKLALFWHSHFAASENKVEHGPMMLDYLQSLRRHAAGPFPILLKTMAKDPALMKYLDLDRAVRGHPNENFAREVMELFTMGIGKYSETDVKEVSRCLTGWAYLDMYYEYGKDNTERLMTLLRDKRPSASFAYLEPMRDRDPKTVLGMTKDFTGDEILDILALRPETATFISRKLWEFFAYENPDPAVVAPLAKVFLATKGDIRAVVATLVKSPAFWSETCVRNAVASPADYVVGTARQQGLAPVFLAMREKGATPTTPASRALIDATGELVYTMETQGQNLLYPPDVSGWKPGKGWISPATMTARLRWRGAMIWGEKGPREGALNVLAQVKAFAPKDAAATAGAMLLVFNADVTPDILARATKIVTDRGAEKIIDNPGPFTDAMWHILTALHASPGAQLV